MTLSGGTACAMGILQRLSRWKAKRRSGNTTYSFPQSRRPTSDMRNILYGNRMARMRETYICWMDSSDVNLSDDGTLSADFDGKQFFLGDASGELHVCCATELERNEEYAKYAIPIIIERQTEETDGIPHFDYQNAYIHVKVDEEHPDGIIIGVYESMDTDSSLFPDKQVIELQEGDSIMPFNFCQGYCVPGGWKRSALLRSGRSLPVRLNISCLRESLR